MAVLLLTSTRSDTVKKVVECVRKCTKFLAILYALVISGESAR
jgi:hypothetical protein